MDVLINRSVAALLIAIFGGISAILTIKRLSKEFEEIIIEEGEKIKLYFFNKAKRPKVTTRAELQVKAGKETLEFREKETEAFIGRVYKNRMEEPERWEELRDSFVKTSQ